MKRFFLAFMLLASAPMFAQTPEVDVTNPASLVAYLTPFIVLVATFIVKQMKKTIPGWATMIVVSAISAIVSWLTNLLGQPDLSWLAQFGLGLSATFINQVYRQFTEE